MQLTSFAFLLQTASVKKSSTSIASNSPDTRAPHRRFPRKMKTYAPASLVATSLAVVGGGTILVLSMASAVTAFVPPSPQLLQQPLSSVVAPAPTHSTQSSALFVTAEEQEDLFLERTMTAPAGEIRPDIIYIILFNPQTPFEAIHTVKFPRGADFDQSTADLLLAFESFDDCVAFAEVLRSDPAVDAGEPVATPSSYGQIEQACQKMRLPMKVVPAQASQ